MLLQRFVHVLCWSWCATLAIAAIVVVGRPLLAHGIDAWQWCMIAAGVGLVAAGAITWLKRYRLIDAAAEIDRRYALDERISSALALAPAELSTPAGQALAHDATAASNGW